MLVYAKMRIGTRQRMDRPNDYTYDVFFSYKRHELTADWTRKVHDHLKLWLSEEIQQPAKMFIDAETIETGDRWPEKIKEGLNASRCMVSVWSPLYFQSSWCMSEWQTFLGREKLVNAGSPGLIAPVRFHDGDSFPLDAKNTQSLDLTPYASCVPAFWASPRALELEDKIKGLARAVAKIIHGAPPFQTNWPIVEAEGLSAPKIPLGRL